MTEEVKKNHSVKAYFHRLLDMRSNMLPYDELHDMMEENTVIHGANMWILMLAILIASIGLNVNSTAVIIGAMLISPLMSGILTMGYSIAIHDLPMLRKALTSFGTQVLISLIASTVYFAISPLDTATEEMIARTSPTIWDVLIALFGGIAGSIGNTRKKASNVIPGVAIATALMPPLCTVGYGIATGRPTFIFGAFYLFLINTLFIMLSALIVTKLLRVPVVEEIDAKRKKRIARIIHVMVVVTVLPSILAGAYTVYLSVLNQSVSDYLKNEFVFADTQLVQSSSDNQNHVISVSLVGSQISDERISELEQKLAEYNLSGYTLKVTQNKTVEGADSDKVTIAVQENTINELQQQLKQEQEKNESLTSELSEQVNCADIAQKAAAVFTDITDIRCGLVYGEDGTSVLLSGKAEKPLSSSEQQTLKNFLTAESGIEKTILQINGV